MKKSFVVIFAFLNANSFSQCPCTISIPTINCTSETYSGFPGGCKVDTGFSYGAKINLPVGGTVLGDTICNLAQFSWFPSNVLVHADSMGYQYTITDTGTYILREDLIVVTATVHCYDTVHVYYRSATAVSEVNNPSAFQIYPTVSTGTFYIKTNEQDKIKKIQVFDGVGRVICVDYRNDGEISLRDFANGIYFYAIEDKKEHIYRGKLVKE